MAIPQGRVGYAAAKDRCEASGVATTYEEETVVEGWLGKPKGLKQVLWERGLIDAEKLSSYSKDGPKDEEGHRDTTYSFAVLMESCLDFLQERTSLQKLGEALGVMIEHTPKYHAEMAGEGVEYDWGCGKQRYRRQPLAQKRPLAKFRSTVAECFGIAYLSLSIVRKTARRARGYICAHHWLDNGAVGLPDIGDITLAKIEQLSKKMRTHRCAFDFDKGFIDLTSTSAST